MAANVKSVTFKKDNPQWKSWHGLEEANEPILQGDSPLTATKKAKIDNVEVVSCDVGFTLDGEFYANDSKKMLVMKNCFWQPNGVQSLNRLVRNYNSIQNRQYAEVLESLGEEYQVIGTGMVGGRGEWFFLQFELPEFYVADLEQEQHTNYLLVGTNRITGKRFWGQVATRVVCENTVVMATSETGLSWLPTGKNSLDFLKFRTKMENFAAKGRKKQVEELNYLFTKKVTNEQVTQLANGLFPLPSKPKKMEMVESAMNLVVDGSNVHKGYKTAKTQHESNVKNALNAQNELLNNFFKFNDEHSYGANTAYAALNAATEQLCHSDAYNKNNLMQNNLFGNKMQVTISQGKNKKSKKQNIVRYLSNI